MPFLFRVPVLKLSIRKMGPLIIKGLLRNLDKQGFGRVLVCCARGVVPDGDSYLEDHGT